MLQTLVLLGMAAAASPRSEPPALRYAQPVATIDTTFAVSPTAEFRLDASAGRVSVRVWDRRAVRVVATPAGGTTVRITSATNLVSVLGVADRRIDDAVYEITVPSHMPVTVGTGDLGVDIEGCEGGVVAKNYSGRITVGRTKGPVTVKSALGEVVVHDAAGRVSVQSQYAPIKLTDVNGDVEVEGSANHLYLTRVDARTLSASTVNGGIWFSGPLHGDGRYSLSTHSGSVFLTVPPPVNATVHVSTVSGAFASPLPMTRQEGSRRGSFTVKFGNGAASLDVETFNGGIVVQPLDAAAKAPD
jgi:hypothetical protein